MGGRDRARFLHAVTTQAVLGLAPGDGAYGAVTDDRGRPVSDFWLFVLPEAIVLEVPAPCADAFRAALERWIVADDVTLAWAEGTVAGSAEDAPGMARVTWDAHAAAGAPVEEDDLARYPARCAAVLAAPRFGRLSRLAFVADGAAAHRAPPAGDAAYDEAQILAFRPGPAEFALADVWSELDVPEAVSFSKGCFPGQEILQRVRSRGELKRRLVALEFEDAPGGADPAWSGATLETPGGEPAGTITRAARGVAFAFVRRPAFDPGTRLIARRTNGSPETIGATVRPHAVKEAA